MTKLYIKIFLLFSIFHFPFSISYAQTAAPKYSNEFLSIGVGARALGMSNSTVASVSDVSSGYWNPAGLLGIKSNLEVSVMHSEYFAGIAKYDYGSFAYRIDTSSVIGLSLIRFGVDNIPNTTELIDANGNINYDRVVSFSAADYAFLFSYARKSKIQGLNFGGNAKVVHRIVGEFATAWGFGLDAGAQYQLRKWKFGAMARDVTSTFNAWNYTLSDRVKEVWTQTGNNIPPNSVEITLPKLILGAARRFDIKNKFSVLAEANIDATFDRKRNVVIKSNFASIDPHLGLEIGYSNFVYLRAGIGNIQQVTDINNKSFTSVQPNMGVGLRLKHLTIDYALTNIGDKSIALYSNIFSLKLEINKKK